ncbi:hypothetical protein [Nonomuraea sp. NEAU-A123]|uniref:hypothetical protein n=1 Tax=Nonomuraea sp. NEAU-A123 TaxID=2839649 RepID=UPI001BE3E292|nr:hypothetical protein [Nonomuraea sp. NEAU-A123]MBT2228998.1 hypothetical protein [Nonomuraea sp. NEAU-A123]
MRIALLGELELRDDDDGLVEIAGVRLRRLLARLVLAGGRPGSAEGLVGAVWGDEPRSYVEALAAHHRLELGRGAGRDAPAPPPTAA